MTPGQIRSLCAHGGWVPIGQGVYRRTDVAQTLHQRLLAATMQCGRTAALSHASAAWLWGLAGHSAYGPIHVRSDRTATSRQPAGVALHRGPTLPLRWVTRHLGIPVVRPEIVALQLLVSQVAAPAGTAAAPRPCARDAAAPPAAAVADVDTMWSQRLLTPDSIARCLADLGTRGRRGVGAVRRYLAARPDSDAHPVGPLEQRLIELVASAGGCFERLRASDRELPCGRIELVSVDGSLIVRVHHGRYRAALEEHGCNERLARSTGPTTTNATTTGCTVIEFDDAEVWKRPRFVVDTVLAALEVQRVSV